MRKTIILIAIAFIGFAGCSDSTKTTVKEEYPATVTKPATVTETHTKEVKVHEDEAR